MPKADLTVLIVDDEPHIRHSMSRILISLGYSVRCAEDGNTALARIRQNCPDFSSPTFTWLDVRLRVAL